MFTSFSGFGVYAVGDTSETAQPVEAERVREIESLREVNSQTYLLSDGKYQCVVYAEDKFYEDSRGKLVEIDNSVTSAKHTRGSVEYAFKNKAGKSDVYFSDATGNIFINAEKGALTFAPKATRSTAKTVLGTKYSLKAADFVISGDDVIAYTDVYPNTDIVYQVTNIGIKEYTVLKAKPETNSVIYVFEHEGLSVSQGKKTVSFKNAKGDEVFSLGTLFALDNAGNYTENISYKLTAVDKYTTEITVALDESYIENASFPIVIDPTVMITGQTNTYDTFVSSANPNTNYYMNTYLRTGKDTPFGVRRTYIKFNLPSSIMSLDEIGTARLNIRRQSGEVPTVKAYTVLADWGSSTINWSNKPYYNSIINYSMYLYQNNWYRIILKDLVNEWINGLPNYGIVLIDDTEDNTSQWTTFYSSDAASPNKPELVIEYGSSYTPQYDTVYLNSYYDDGYYVYYNESSAVSAQKISSYTTAVVNRFNQLFDVTLVTNSVSHYDSPLDQCKGTVTNNNVDALCSHDGNHSLRDNVLTAFRSAYNHSLTTKTIYWSGHKIVSYKADGTPDYNRSCQQGNQVLLIEQSDSYERDIHSKGILFHEVCHFFGAPDHYCEIVGDECVNKIRCSDCGDNPRPESCIMNNSRGDISLSTVLCDACKADIQDYIDTYFFN